MEGSAQRLGIGLQDWYLQGGPCGDIVIVSITADDPDRAMRQLAASEEPFDCWFKDQVLQLSGINLSKARGGPMAQHIYSYGETLAGARR